MARAHLRKHPITGEKSVYVSASADRPRKERTTSKQRAQTKHSTEQQIAQDRLGKPLPPPAFWDPSLYPSHDQAPAKIRGQEIMIDQNLAPLIEACNNAGLPTCTSCEDHYKTGFAFISFVSPSHAEGFLLAGHPHPERLPSDTITAPQPNRDPQPIENGPFEWQMLWYELPDGWQIGCVDDRESNDPEDRWLAVRFPTEDVGQVTERFRSVVSDYD